MTCPLCTASRVTPYASDAKRDYLECQRCRLVFVPPPQRLPPEVEKTHYEHHENSPEDQGYRRFLSRLATPLSSHLAPHSKGLDFGCGPGPTLSVMMEEIGHSMSLYDPFFFPDTSVLSSTYDFITATEVVEHLYAPGEVISSLYEKLHPGGWLGVMTKRVRDPAAFASWHYKNDPTHVCFFHLETFHWLRDALNAHMHVVGDDVVLLQRPQR